MTYDEFSKKLNALDLSIKLYSDNLWSIGYSKIANPMLYFNPSIEEDDYMGNVDVKAINLRLFTAEELRESLLLVNKLLLTEKAERGELIRLT